MFEWKIRSFTTPPYFHWREWMWCKAAKTQGEECRIEDVIGRYGESGLSCSLQKSEKTNVLIVRNSSSGNVGVGVHRFMVETTFVVVW